MGADLVQTLRAAGCVFAEEEAAVLATADPADLPGLVARRVAGEPLEHLVGWVEFRGRRIVVGPGAFVPRRRTELLVERAIALAPASPVIVELCCGAAAVATVLAALPGAEVHAADIDPVAAGYARRNLGSRVYVGDLDAPLPPGLRADLIVANAPYVPSDEIAFMPVEARDHEPRVALDGGSDGLDLHRRIAALAPGRLRPGGHLLIETSRRQAPGTAAAMTAHGLRPRVVESEELDATVVEGALP